MYRVTAETDILTFLVAKNEFAFSFRPTNESLACVSIAHVDIDVKRLGFVLKTTRFNDSESTLSFERQ